MLILASASPRRREILNILGVSFQVIPSNFEEEGVTAPSPFELVNKLAIMKGKELSLKQSLPVLSADTIVEINGEILGKPKSSSEAMYMLRKLSGKAHNVTTGVALSHKGDILDSFTETTKVYFKEISEDEMNWYISTKDPFDKAGGYGIQTQGGIFVDKIEGCYFNVVGLPLSRTANLLRHHDLFKLEV